MVLLRFCHRTHKRAARPLLSSSLDPRRLPWLGAPRIRLMRAAGDGPVKARPLPAVTGAMPRFLSSDERVTRRYGSDQHATPLVIVQWGRRARRRSPTCHHYHCTTEGPSCNALSAKRNAHRRPEAPSVESSKLDSGFDWWRVWILKRGSTRPTRECLLLPRMIVNPTRRTTLRLEW